MESKFQYKYSAPTQAERKEIEYIQNQYKNPYNSANKLEYLRKLDNRVKAIPAAVALALGIVGVLLFGLGLAMVFEWNLLIWGIIVSVVGCVPMGFAYFAYNKIHIKLKNKYTPEILKISSELLNEESSKEQ